MDTPMEFVKGHGTENDFVILPDPYAQIEVTRELVTALCDRHRGLGADGVLRVATAGALVAEGVLDRLPDGVSSVDWFMDYRNADGSIAEMCGNGVRVFAHFCHSEGLVDTPAFDVGSRAGARPVVVHSADTVSADISVGMGTVRMDGTSTVSLGASRKWTGTVVDVGNPHLVCVDAGLIDGGLEALELTDPVVDAEVFPNGVNVEMVTPLAAETDATGEPDDGARQGARFAARMRVWERGVGETRSCGTGLVAAATAALADAGHHDGQVAMSVPGGQVTVTVVDGRAVLRGPSRLVARGQLLPGWDR